MDDIKSNNPHLTGGEKHINKNKPKPQKHQVETWNTNFRKLTFFKEKQTLGGKICFGPMKIKRRYPNTTTISQGIC